MNKMKNENYEVMQVEDGRHIKMWTKGVPVEESAKQQLANTARMPFIYKHIAVMPDVHLGKGSTIGSVVPTLGAIIPAAVGVDIGCGMPMTCRTACRHCARPSSAPSRTACRRKRAASAAVTKVRGTRRRQQWMWHGAS
jgi:tRNA-splicing ligase RtcB